jgi:pimeloyl-ACP methyl ester carboxylesterase
MKSALSAALLFFGTAVVHAEVVSTVRSKDGTEIAFSVSGAGKPLVLVHGTTADHSRWAPILPALEKKFKVVAIDRRGRGKSGDAKTYALEREFEDVAAVVESFKGEKVFLLGHSYGAICALEAAARSKNVAALILYEPPIPTRGPIVSTELIAKLDKLLASGDRDGVVSTFFSEVVHMPSAELDLLKKAPNWPARVAAAHTIPREELGTNNYHFAAQRIAALKKIPVRLLLGGDSPAFFREAIELIKQALPSAEVVVMPGQQHTAINTAPALFTERVVEFLTK